MSDFVIILSNDVVQADDIQNEANELLRIRDYLFKELAQKTGQPVEQVSHRILSLKHSKEVYGSTFFKPIR